MTDETQPQDESPTRITGNPDDVDPSWHPDEPGAYVGRKPERQADTIPGGIGPEDERISATETQVRPDSD